MKLNKLSSFACAATLALTTVTADAKTYRVGYNNWIGFIAFFAAKEKGDFKAAGLDVEARSFNAPGEGLVPLLTGDLDAHLTTLDAVVLKSAEAPGKIQIVGLIDTSNGGDAVVASKDVKTVADLKGKKVAVTIGECNEILLIKALESAGLTKDDITLVNIDPDAAGAALKAGSVDAAVTWEPWITELSGAGGNVLFSTVDAPNILLDCVAVTTDSTKGEATKKFLAVLDASTKWVKANPTEAAALVASVVELPASDIEEMLTKVTLYDAADSKTLMGTEIPAVATELAQFFKDQGTIQNEVVLEDLLNTRYLP
jgi:NitT/TauT family transport system substrate-binding protein